MIEWILLWSLIVIVVIFVVRCLSKFVRKSRNVFLLKSKPDTGDINEEEIIKKQYGDHRSTLIDKKYDTIVIGSGMSGMVNAAILTRAGQKVLVLEQNEALGGMVMTWTEDGYEFPSGLHFLCNTAPERSIRIILDYLTEKKVSYKEYPREFNTIFVDDKEYLICVEFDKYLVEKFPKEKKNIDAFFKIMKRMQFFEFDFIPILQAIPKFIRGVVVTLLEKVFGWVLFKFNNMTIEETLDYFKFKDRDLRRLLGYFHILQGKYENTTGLQLIGLVASLSYNCYSVIDGEVLGGKSYPIGGCNEIVKKTCATITKYGGEMYASAKVKKILVKNNTVKGVMMDNGDKIFAKNVVSTAGLLNTYSFLDKKRTPKELKTVDYSVQHFCIFCAFKGTYKELELPPREIIMVRGDYEKNEKEYMKNEGSVEPHIVFIGNPNHIHEQEGKTLLTIIVGADFENWKKWEGTKIKQRGNEYDDFKNTVVDIVFKYVYKKYPKLENALEYFQSGTPLTTKHWTAQPRGESYGIAPDSKRLFDINDKFISKLHKINGLFLSGMDTYLCSGVSSAAYSGVWSAGLVLKRKVYKEFEEAKKIIRKEIVRKAKRKSKTT